MLSVKEINLLLAQNEGYRKQNESLQKMNAALKGILDAYKMSENEANEIIAELKAENEKLKEEIKEKESEIRQKRMTILMNNDHYLTVDEKNRKYKQTLQEIKAIVKKNISYQDTDSTTRAMTKILDLITKAEEE